MPKRMEAVINNKEHDQILVKVMLVCNKTKVFYYCRFLWPKSG
jgi:hypothetical protein